MSIHIPIWRTFGILLIEIAQFPERKRASEAAKIEALQKEKRKEAVLKRRKGSVAVRVSQICSRSKKANVNIDFSDRDDIGYGPQRRPRISPELPASAPLNVFCSSIILYAPCSLSR